MVQLLAGKEVWGESKRRRILKASGRSWPEKVRSRRVPEGR